MTENVANFSYSQLSATIGASDTSLSVISAGPFSATGNFRILVDNELMLVTAVSGATFTVARGQEGTAAASHTAGVQVSQVLTAAGLQSFITGLIPAVHNKRTYVSRSVSAFNVGDSSSTAIAWDTSVIDQLSAWDGATKFVIATPGWYHIGCWVHWAPSSAGLRALDLLYNGSAYFNGFNTCPCSLTDDQKMHVSGLVNVQTAGDFIQAMLFQTTGSNLTITEGNFWIYSLDPS